MTDPRELLDMADRYRRTSQGAERARALIRLGERPGIRKGILGFFNRGQGCKDVTFTEYEVSAIYDALADVRNENERLAKEYEAKVKVEG